MPVDLGPQSQSLGPAGIFVIISYMLWWLNTIINGKWSKNPAFYVSSSLWLSTAYTKMVLSQNRELEPSCLSSCLPLSSYYNFFFFLVEMYTSYCLICQELPTSSFFHCWHLPLLFSGVIGQEGCRERIWHTKKGKIHKRCISRILTLMQR